MSWWDNASEDELKRYGLENENPFHTNKPIKSNNSELIEENKKLKKEIQRLKKKLGK